MNAKTLKSLKLSNHKLRRCRMNSLKCALLASAVTLADLTTSAAWTVNNASSPTEITSEDGIVLKVSVLSSSAKTLRVTGATTMNGQTVVDLSTGIDGGWKVTILNSGAEGFGGKFSGITTFRAPDVESVTSYSFTWHKTLADVYFPSCTNISRQAFNNCTALTNAVFSPKLEAIGFQAFYNNTALVSFSPMTLTKLTTLGEQAFTTCSKLQGEWILDSPAITSLPNGVFWSNKAVTNFVFRKSAVTALGEWALYSVAENGGSVYFHHTAPTLGANAICATSNSKRLRIYVPDLDENEDWKTRMAKCVDYFNSHNSYEKDSDYPGPKTAGMIKMAEIYYSWVIPWTPSAGLMLIIR